jgi:hypothetical protein
MANPIVQQINTELETLKNKLSEFKSTVAYLNNAKENMAEAIETLNGSEKHFDKKIEELKSTYNSFVKLTDTVSEVTSKIDSINFPERLDNIESTVQETITQLEVIKKETLEELQKASKAITNADFDGKFDNLQKEITISVKSNNNLSESIEKQKLGEKIVEFERLVSKSIRESFKETTRNTNKIATDNLKAIQDLNLHIGIEKLDRSISDLHTITQNVEIKLENVEKSISVKLKDIASKQADLLSDFDKKFENITKKQVANTYITWIIIIIDFVTTFLFLK